MSLGFRLHQGRIGDGFFEFFPIFGVILGSLRGLTGSSVDVICLFGRYE